MRKSEIYKIMWKARKEIDKLMYNDKGGYKKGLREKQKRMMNRFHFFLFQMSCDDVEGIYIPKHDEKSINNISKALWKISDDIDEVKDELNKIKKEVEK